MFGLHYPALTNFIKKRNWNMKAIIT